MNSTTRSIVSILIAVVLVVASINIISVPASAASGDLEIVDVEEINSGESIDKLSKNQPIEVTIDYSLTGQSSYTIGVYDDELGNFGNNDEITTTEVNNDEGQVELTVPAGEIANVLEDDGNKNQIELQAGVPAYFNPIEQFEVTSETVEKDIVTSTVYLRNVPESIAQGTTGTVTIYGWSEESYPEWELIESDTLNNQITRGTAAADNDGYYKNYVEFEASEYTGGFGDPPIDVFAKSTDSSSTSSTYEIAVPDNTPPRFNSLSATPSPAEEDQLIEFDGSVTDPDGDSMSMSVEHIGGPEPAGYLSAYLDGSEIQGNFIAPEVRPDSSKEIDIQFTVSDGTSSSTESVTIPIQNAQATITDVRLPSGTYQKGDNVEAEIQVKNDGDRQRTFYIGYGVSAASESEWRNNDGTTHTDVTVSGGTSSWVSVDWTVSSGAPSETYDTRLQIWEEGGTEQNADLEEELDRREDQNVFEIDNDPDDDGIPNSEDQCNNEPEDMDGYQDDNGCPENPEPSVSLDNTQVDEGGSTTLTADATDPEGESLSYEWSLSGDGALSGSGSSVAYEAPSGVSSDTSVVASVTVSEQDEGKTAQDEATVTVQDSSSNNDPDGDGIPNSEDQCNNEPEDMDGYQDDDGCPENPAPSVSLAGAQVSEGETTTLTANANDPEGESLSYEWSLSGDGSLSESGSSATYEAPSSISSDTSATVSITVSEQDAGKSAQDSATVTVTDTGSEDEEQNQPPEVTLDVNPASAEVDQSVTFDGTGTSDSDGRITEYRWDFDGDGTIDRATSTETVTYTYAEAGSYTPELIAVDDDGARGTDTATVSVGSENVDPIANDIDVSTSEDSPVSETFFASDPDGDSLSYTIESPPSDGTVSVSGGSFTYTPESISSGTDSFVYRVNDGNGGTDTATVSITVTEPNTNDGYEPNDEFDTAASITDGNYTDLQIVDGESDYFAVTLEEGGSIDASIEFDHNTGDLDMALYEPDREALVASISTSDGESVSATDVSKGGTYYVEVRGYSDASAPYDLRVDVGSPQPSGVIIGDVVDTEANPIPGAQVRITNPSDSVIAETTTDSSGIYTVEVPPGEYTVIVESNGSTTERTVLVEPGATINADVVIQTAASESVSPSVSISNAPDRIGPNETFVIDYEIENTGTVTGPFVLDIPASTPGVTVQDIDGDIQGSDTSAEPVTAATNRVGPNETVAVSVTYDASDLSTEDITLELTARQPLDSTSDSVSSTITVTESTDPTERALQRFDGDGDGTIDRDEAVGAIVAYNIGTTIGGEEVTRTQVVRAIVAYNTGEPIET